MGIRWTTSAVKHGVTHHDAEFAILNYLYWASEFDEPRVPGRRRPDLIIGPNSDWSELLEVIAVVHASDDMIVFHAMTARTKMIETAKGGQRL